MVNEERPHHVLIMNWSDEDNELALKEGWFVVGGVFHMHWHCDFSTILQLLKSLEKRALDGDSFAYRAFMEPLWSGGYNQFAMDKKYVWILQNNSTILRTIGPYLTQDELFNEIQRTADNGCLLSRKAVQVLCTRKLKGK